MPDSQSARSHQGGRAIGYDAGERVRCRRRHLPVDTRGLVLRVVVHSASVQDRAGAKSVLAGIRSVFPQVGLVRVDRARRGDDQAAMIRLMAARLAGEEVEPHGPVETEAARRLADDLKNE